ncbi:MAG: dTDP-4-dehydrorhamnose reductase [Bacteroidales bacterium]|jgi:methionyl-tRNA formyltransferase|nr:dTDP-4-dehydrorhamnose reductase [Bacteroidales bacterium]
MNGNNELTVLVTGSNGQLGRAMRMEAQKRLSQKINPDKRLKMLYCDVEELDITDQNAVYTYCTTFAVDIIVNCAAYTDVDKAETDVEQAYLLNETGVAHLAAVAKVLDLFLIHISTDYVFAGTATLPYSPDMPTDPGSVYGKSKLAGELAVKRSGCRSAIIRTSWLYSKWGNNFVKSIIRNAQEKTLLRVVNDQWGAPTYAPDLAFAIFELIDAPDLHQSYHIYHYANQGKITWYDFAKTIVAFSCASCKVEPITSADYPSIVKRPACSVFNLSDTEKKLKITIPHWEDSLKDYFNHRKTKIVFMGTPEFAVASLEALLQEELNIVAVVTAPDKPAGRGKQLQMSEVKKCALTHHLPLLQPDKLKDPSFIAQLQALQADLFIVVAFRMLPEVVFAMPPLRTFNVHGSLLPNYRGAAPIHWAVINGETETGVTTFFLNKEIDKGNIIDQKKVAIGKNETTGELYERLMYLGATLSVETVKNIEKGAVITHPQIHEDTTILKPAPKIYKEDTLINWDDSAEHLFNKIRGLSPFPGAYTRIKNKEGEIEIVKCFLVSISTELSKEKAGTFVSNGRDFLAVNTNDYMIFIQSLQFQGKKRLEIEQFLPGFRANNYINLFF